MENHKAGITFPYKDRWQDPGEEEFWFYYYDGVSVSHPDDPFWDMVTQETIQKERQEELFHIPLVKEEEERKPPTKIIRI